jgi:hypothetical protein
MIAACVRPGDKSKFMSLPKTPLHGRKVASFVVYGITPLVPFFCPVCVLVYIPPGKLFRVGARRFALYFPPTIIIISVAHHTHTH